MILYFTTQYGFSNFSDVKKENLKDIIIKECQEIIYRINNNDNIACVSDEIYYSEPNKNITVYGRKSQNYQMLAGYPGCYYVYRITNLKSGKVYHGISESPMRRIHEHCNPAIKKSADRKMLSDSSSLMFEIVFICDNFDIGREIERFYNKRLQNKNFSYNINI